MTAAQASTRAFVLLLALAGHAALAQAPAPYKDAVPVVPKPRPRKPRTPAVPPAFNPALILLDPAHGGSDPGGQIAPNLPEKQVTLDFARRLRTLLQAKGFSVVLTRESDPVPQPTPPPPPPPDPDNPDAKPTPPPPPVQVTPDQRAELANRIHPVACILIHATTSGHGVHLYTSALTSPLASEPTREVLFWDTAQAPAMVNSAKLTTGLAEAINGLRIPLVTGQASIRPIDSMTCPAVALELSPLAPIGGASTTVTDQSYQQHIAEAVTTALSFWRVQAQNLLDEQAAFAAREAERAAALGTAKRPEAKPSEKPAARPKPAPGSLVPNAPGPLPKIPQIPKIVTPKSSVPNPSGDRPGGKW